MIVNIVLAPFLTLPICSIQVINQTFNFFFLTPLSEQLLI